MLVLFFEQKNVVFFTRACLFVLTYEGFGEKKIPRYNNLTFFTHKHKFFQVLLDFGELTSTRWKLWPFYVDLQQLHKTIEMGEKNWNVESPKHMWTRFIVTNKRVNNLLGFLPVFETKKPLLGVVFG